jgi:hypothetical protein
MSKDDLSKLEIDGNAKLQYLRIGDEAEPLVKVDSFLKGINELKRYAITNNQFSASDNFYPGIRMKVPDPYVVSLIRFLGKPIREFFEQDVRKIRSAASRFSIVTTQPSELDILQRLPHFDAPSRYSLAAIHYLCDAPDSGTKLYRHRRTGFEFIDDARINHYKRTVSEQFADPARHPSGYICGSSPEYEEIASFEAVYNRLVMYRGSSLHSGIIGPEYNFDPSPTTGRLTITTFIEFSV